MTDTRVAKRLAVLQAMTAQIQTITPANGYNIDLSQSVFRGRTKFGDDEALPAVSILEATQPGAIKVATEDETFRSSRWPLLVQGWVKDDKSNPLDPAYYLCACVSERLAAVVAVNPANGNAINPAIYRFGKLIAGMEVGPGICRPPDQYSARAQFFMPVSVEFVDNAANPWV